MAVFVDRRRGWHAHWWHEIAHFFESYAGRSRCGCATRDNMIRVKPSDGYFPCGSCRRALRADAARLEGE